MATIGIVGANGKVGMEVSLLLACMEGVAVVPVVRSDYAAAYLRQCGLEPTVARDDSELAAALEACDAVADFSLPVSGLSKDRRSDDVVRVRRLLLLTPTRSAFVFLSSTMAFGMGSADRAHKDRRISRNSYGASKRRAEHEVISVARSSGRVAFVLRLGQVNGDLQPVTASYVEALRQGPLRVRGGLHSPSNVVTCFTIACSLRSVADGSEAAGVYTVVEQPEWTWAEFFTWVAAGSNQDAALEELPEPRSGAAATLSRIAARLSALPRRLALDNRDVILSYAPVPPSLEYRLKIRHLRRKASAEVAQRPAPGAALDLIVGPVPGPRLRLPSGSSERAEVERRLRRLLDDRLGDRSHIFGR